MTKTNLQEFEDRINERTAYLEHRADEFGRAGILSPADVRFRSIAPRFIAEAYFLLSEAYKERRLRDGSSTEAPKIAAMMTLAILAVAPFQPVNPLNVRMMATVIANPLFALFNASSIINNDFTGVSDDSYRRTLNFMRHLRMPCIRSYIIDISLGSNRAQDVYDVNPSDVELAHMDAVTLLYELLWKKQ